MTILTASVSPLDRLIHVTATTPRLRSARWIVADADTQNIVVTETARARQSTHLTAHVGQRTIFVKGKAKATIRRANTFKHFSHYSIGQPDPAMALSQNMVSGAALDSAAPSLFRRIYTQVLLPQDYDGSDSPIWSRAAFLGIGVRVNALPSGSAFFIDGAQAEWALNGAQSPSDYGPARALRFNVRPNRLNYCPNPRLANDATGYATATGSPTRVSQGSVWAAQSIPATNGYLASPSAATRAGEYWVGRADVTGPWGTTVSVRLHDGVGFVSPEKIVRMTGSRVTIPLSSDRPVTGTTIRVRATAQATPTPFGSTDTMQMTKVLLEKVAGPNYTPGPFFDGDSGDDYLWKQNATPGSAESFYYEDRASRDGLLRLTIQNSVALGAIPAFPEYALLP